MEWYAAARHHQILCRAVHGHQINPIDRSKKTIKSEFVKDLRYKLSHLCEHDGQWRRRTKYYPGEWFVAVCFISAERVLPTTSVYGPERMVVFILILGFSQLKPPSLTLWIPDITKLKTTTMQEQNRRSTTRNSSCIHEYSGGSIHFGSKQTGNGNAAIAVLRFDLYQQISQFASSLKLISYFP
jgi:hypothetical protein